VLPGRGLPIPAASCAKPEASALPGPEADPPISTSPPPHNPLGSAPPPAGAQPTRTPLRVAASGLPPCRWGRRGVRGSGDGLLRLNPKPNDTAAVGRDRPLRRLPRPDPEGWAGWTASKSSTNLNESTTGLVHVPPAQPVPSTTSAADGGTTWRDDKGISDTGISWRQPCLGTAVSVGEYRTARTTAQLLAASFSRMKNTPAADAKAT
jgi:hypothetical protein